jgi:hypothetical protein
VAVLEDDHAGGDVTVETSTQTGQENEYSAYEQNVISAGYFSTMQIPLLAGRQFRESDSQPTSKVAVVNETFVKYFLPGRNPIGLHFGFGAGRVRLDHSIIGVVADSKHGAIRSKI